MRVREDADESDAEETPRISRSEYKKMQSAADRAKTLADRKTAVKETLISIALRYILPSLIIFLDFIGYQYFTGNLLVKKLGKSYFLLLYLLNIIFYEDIFIYVFSLYIIRLS